MGFSTAFADQSMGFWAAFADPSMGFSTTAFADQSMDFSTTDAADQSMDFSTAPAPTSRWTSRPPLRRPDDGRFDLLRRLVDGLCEGLDWSLDGNVVFFVWAPKQQRK